MIGFQKLLTAIGGILLLFSCGSNTPDPKDVAKSFIEAFLDKNYDKAATFATKDGKTLLELVKSMDEMGNSINFFQAGLDEEAIKNAVYENVEINGEKAIVKVTIGRETQSIKLLMEDGEWKVALDKDTLQEKVAEESGSSVNEMNTTMNEALKATENLPTDSITAAIDNAANELADDSLREVLKKTRDALKKAGEGKKEPGSENQ